MARGWTMSVACHWVCMCVCAKPGPAGYLPHTAWRTRVLPEQAEGQTLSYFHPEPEDRTGHWSHTNLSVIPESRCSPIFCSPQQRAGPLPAANRASGPMAAWTRQWIVQKAHMQSRNPALYDFFFFLHDHGCVCLFVFSLHQHAPQFCNLTKTFIFALQFISTALKNFLPFLFENSAEPSPTHQPCVTLGANSFPQKICKRG